MGNENFISFLTSISQKKDYLDNQSFKTSLEILINSQYSDYAKILRNMNELLQETLLNNNRKIKKFKSKYQVFEAIRIYLDAYDANKEIDEDSVRGMLTFWNRI